MNDLNLKEISLEFLNNLNFSFNSEEFAYISGSIVEGFGHSNSDLDLFVILKDEKSLDNFEKKLPKDEKSFLLKEKNKIIFNYLDENIRIDCEAIILTDFESIIVSLNSFSSVSSEYVKKISESSIDFIHRFKIGKPVLNENYFNKKYAMVNFEKLGLYISISNQQVYLGLLEDINGTFKSEDYGTSFFLLNELINVSINSYLAINGETNPNKKWLYRKIKRYCTNKNDYKLLDEYMEMQNIKYDINTFTKDLKVKLKLCQTYNNFVSNQLFNVKI